MASTLVIKNSHTYCKNLQVIKTKYYTHAHRGINWQEKTIACPRSPLIRITIKEHLMFQICHTTVTIRACKVVRIPTRLLESYDFTTLRKHVDPNHTMNPHQVESMLSRDPNHRILYKTVQPRLCYGLCMILLIYLSRLFSCSRIVCHHPNTFSYTSWTIIPLPSPNARPLTPLVQLSETLDSNLGSGLSTDGIGVKRRMLQE